MYRFETFILDIAERQLFRDGTAVPLTPKVFDVLAYLVERAGHLVEKEELLRSIWPDSYVEEANISRIVHTLRRTLGDAADGGRLIETVPKRGYRFAAKVTLVSANEHGPVPVSTGTPRPAVRRSYWPSAGLVGLIVVLIVAGGFFLSTGQTKSLSFGQMVPSRVTKTGDVLAPSVSPDGKLLVFSKHTLGGFGLQVKETGSDVVRDIVPVRNNVRFWGVRFSPDGRSIYYVENKDNDNGTLYRVASSGGDPQKIASHASGGPTIAPDGREIAFVRTDKEAGTTSIMLLDAEGRNERVLVRKTTEDLFMSLDWCPDGASITYVLRTVADGKPKFSIIDKLLDGGAERMIGASADNPIIMAAWVSRSEGLVINAIDKETKLPQIYFRSFPDGVESRITNDLSYYNYISMTADAKSIFTQKVEQDRHIWLVPDVAGPAATQMTFEKEQHPDAVDWLNGDTLIFDPDLNGSHRARNLWTLDIGSKVAAVLTQGGDDNTLGRVAPDGSLVAFISSKTAAKQLWRMTPNGADLTHVLNIPHRIYDHDFSPDGQWIYFQYSVGGEYKFARTPAAGGAVTDIGGKEIQQWSLSPDGSKLAYSTADEQTGKFVIRIRSVDDPATIQAFPAEAFNHLAWSRNGEYIYYVADNDLRKNIWRQSLSGGEPTPVTDFKDAEILDFAESPDGRSLAMIRSKTSFDAVRFDFSK